MYDVDSVFSRLQIYSYDLRILYECLRMNDCRRDVMQFPMFNMCCRLNSPAASLLLSTAREGLAIFKVGKSCLLL